MPTILETAMDLIKIPSTADKPEELQRVVSYVQEFLSTSPGLVIRAYVHNGKPSLVASTIDTLTPDILMIGHLDVVPASLALFEPRTQDGKLIGRGACDMKSEDAVMLHVMRAIAALSHPPSVALMLTTDEEIGGMDGVAYLVNEVGYRCRVALVPDGGERPEELVLESKGAMHIRLTTYGKNVHGSVPWEGQNAIEELFSVYERIRQQFPVNDPTTHWEATCNLGTIQGGHATNQVPDRAQCTLDIRYPASGNADELLERIKLLVPSGTVEVLITASASATPANDPHVQRYAHLLKEQQQLDVVHARNHGGHDGRYVTSLGMPVLVSRPLSGAQHTEEEWVDLQSLERFFELYLGFVQSFC